MPVATPERAQHFTVDQYHRMIDIGVLGEGDAVELLENQIIRKGMCQEDGEPILHRFSEEQCLKMVAAGIISEADAFTLAEQGVDSEMARNPAHDSTIDRVDESIRPLVRSPWRMRIQSAIKISGGEPEPDIAIVRGPAGRYDDHHPGSDEIALLIEISDTTLAYDRGIKLRAYANAEVPVYWIVNLVDRQVDVYSSPKPSRKRPSSYGKHAEYKPGQAISVVIDGKQVGTIAVDSILPPA